MQERTKDDFYRVMQEQLNSVTPEIMEEWRNHILTNAFQNYIKALKVGLMEEWASGAYAKDEVANLRATGMVVGFEFAVGFFDSLRQEEGEDVDNDTNSSRIPTGY